MPSDPKDRPGKMSTLVSSVSPLTGTPSRRGIFTMVSGAEAGRVLSLQVGLAVTVGRNESSSHRIDDASVSGTHARIVAVGDSYVLADERSTNGTFVNGVRVAEPVVLRDGDRVQLGPAALLRFSLVDEAEERALKTMFEAAHRDGLTGAFNRKHLDERLDAELAYARRHGTELSFLLLDVDHFKKVNDVHGHLAGDAVLKTVVGVLVRVVRAEDLVARYGGEEFAVLARDLRLPEACVVGERVRNALSQATTTVDGREVRVTASVGAASVRCCGERRDRLTLLAIADRRLYRAKELGRNRLVADG
jgi:two-component system cell cycle response regulator